MVKINEKLRKAEMNSIASSDCGVVLRCCASSAVFLLPSSLSVESCFIYNENDEKRRFVVGLFFLLSRFAVGGNKGDK